MTEISTNRNAKSRISSWTILILYHLLPVMFPQKISPQTVFQPSFLLPQICIVDTVFYSTPDLKTVENFGGRGYNSGGKLFFSQGFVILFAYKKHNSLLIYLFNNMYWNLKCGQHSIRPENSVIMEVSHWVLWEKPTGKETEGVYPSLLRRV